MSSSKIKPRKKRKSWQEKMLRYIQFGQVQIEDQKKNITKENYFIHYNEVY